MLTQPHRKGRRALRCAATTTVVATAVLLQGCASPALRGSPYTVIAQLDQRTAGYRGEWSLAVREGGFSAPRRGPVLARAVAGSDGVLRFALPADYAVDSTRGTCLWIVNARAALPIRSGPDPFGFRNLNWEAAASMRRTQHADVDAREAAQAALSEAERELQDARAAQATFGIRSAAECRLGPTLAEPARPAAAVAPADVTVIAAGMCALAWSAQLGDSVSANLYRRVGALSEWEGRAAAVGAQSEAKVSIDLPGPAASLIRGLGSSGDTFLQRESALAAFEDANRACKRRSAAALNRARVQWEQERHGVARAPQNHLEQCTRSSQLVEQRLAEVAQRQAALTEVEAKIQKARRTAPDPAQTHDLSASICSY